MLLMRAEGSDLCLSGDAPLLWPPFGAVCLPGEGLLGPVGGAEASEREKWELRGCRLLGAACRAS